MLAGVILLVALGITAYCVRLRSTAKALIASAYSIRTTTDAEREIAMWRKRSGRDLWTETDHTGGDHSYDAEIDNIPIARLRIVKPTSVAVGVTMRQGKLRSVTLIESTGWYPVASVWVQEWFDEDLKNRFHVAGNRRPSTATVEFPSTMPEPQREKAFAINANCLIKPNGCRSAEEILPGVWHLEDTVAPD